jgi:hypothetical protein
MCLVLIRISDSLLSAITSGALNNKTSYSVFDVI